jgi:hypothetical protein
MQTVSTSGLRAINTFLSQRPKGTLYHYTDSTGFLGILESKELWATEIQHLNDAQEFKHAGTLLSVEIARRLATYPTDSPFHRYWRQVSIDAEREARVLGAGVVSFTSNGDQLSQWRAYCPKGNGYSIGVTASSLRYTQKKARGLLVKCVYDIESQTKLISFIADYLEESSARESRMKKYGWAYLGHVSRKIVAVMLALKDEGFAEESEWRLVVTTDTPRYRSGRFGILPFQPLPLCPDDGLPTVAEVIVGPHPEPEIARETASSFLRRHARLDAPADAVKSSSIPYRY